MPGRRAQWTPEQMQRALNAVNNGELSQRDAADQQIALEFLEGRSETTLNRGR